MQQRTTPPAMSSGATLAHRISVGAMGAFVLIATGDGFAQSYAGLYHWAVQHGLRGWKAELFPLMVDLFIAVGELGLFALALEGHRLTRRGLAWADLALRGAIATAGWTVSLVFNVGAVRGLSVQATHAVPPIASMLGLLVLLRTLHRLVGRTAPRTPEPATVPHTLLKQTVIARMARTPARPRHVICAGPTGALPLRTRAPHAARTALEPARPALPHAARTNTPHADDTARPHADRTPGTERTQAAQTSPARRTAKARTPEAGPARDNVTPIGGATTREEWAQRIAQEMAEAHVDGRTWEPDYDDLMARTGLKRRWCEARVSEARVLHAQARVRIAEAITQAERAANARAPHADDAPACTDRADTDDEPARDWAPLRTDASTDARTADTG